MDSEKKIYTFLSKYDYKNAFEEILKNINKFSDRDIHNFLKYHEFINKNEENEPISWSLKNM